MNNRLKKAIAITALTTTLKPFPVNAMTDTAKDILYKGITNYQSSITIPTQNITQQTFNDYLKGLKVYNLDSVKVGGYEGNKLVLYPTYFETKEQMQAVERFASLVASEVEGYTDKEKTYYVAQRVALRMSYDATPDSLSTFSPYSALSTGKGVCQAYARLTDKILKKTGVKSALVEGVVNGEPHLWNLVELKGEWFSVDVTRSDVEEGYVDFSYILMNAKDLADRGYHITYTPYPLSSSSVQDFHNQGLVSLKEGRFYSLTEDGLLSVGYRNGNEVQVTSLGVERFYVVGGDLILLKDHSLKAPGGHVYATDVDVQQVHVVDNDLYLGTQLLHSPTVTPYSKTRVISGDFKVTIKDNPNKGLYYIENNHNRTNVYYNNEFILQLIKR